MIPSNCAPRLAPLNRRAGRAPIVGMGGVEIRSVGHAAPDQPPRIIGDALDDRPAARIDAPHVRAGGASRSSIVVEIGEGNLRDGPLLGRDAIRNARAPASAHLSRDDFAQRPQTVAFLTDRLSPPGASTGRRRDGPRAPSPPCRDRPRTPLRPARGRGTR